MGQVDSLRTEDKFKKTEIGEIPVDWEVLTLDNISEEICRYPTYYNIKYVKQGIPEVRGELIKNNGTLETDLTKYRFISPETASEFPRTRLKKDDFVLSVRGTMGKIAIIPKFLDGANMTANLIRISPDRKKISPLFFHQVLISEKFQETLNITSSSTTIKTIKAPELKRLKFAIPPFSEQKKIAEILSTVDKSIEKKKEIIEKTKELKKGLMQELLTRGIEHKKFKKTRIGEIPADWKVVKLKNIISLNYGKGLPENKREGGRYPVYGSNGIVGYHNNFFIEGPGIIMGRKGTVGGVTWANINFWPIDTTYYISERTNKTDLKWLYYQLIVLKLERLNVTTGIPGLNRNVALNLKIALPSLSEQKKIAEILSSVDKKIEKEIAQKERLEDIKKGLMQVLLTGNVRVRT